jgi:hypothetical protein
MPRTYPETVSVPRDLSLTEVEAIWRFAFARRGTVVTRRANITTLEGTTIEEDSLADAIAALEPGEQVEGFEVWISNAGTGERLWLVWFPAAGAKFMRFSVTSADQTRALGIAEAVRRFIEDRGYTDQTRYPPDRVVRTGGSSAEGPTTESGRETTAEMDEAVAGRSDLAPTARPTGGGLLNWLHGLSIEVVGGLLVIGIVALLGVLWAVLR